MFWGLTGGAAGLTRAGLGELLAAGFVRAAAAGLTAGELRRRAWGGRIGRYVIQCNGRSVPSERQRRRRSRSSPSGCGAK